MDIKAYIVSSWQYILENEVRIDIYTDCWKGSIISKWLSLVSIPDFCTELFTELHHWTFVCFLLAWVQWIGLKSPLLASEKLQLHFHHIDVQFFGHSPNIQKALRVKSFLYFFRSFGPDQLAKKKKDVNCCEETYSFLCNPFAANTYVFCFQYMNVFNYELLP